MSERKLTKKQENRLQEIMQEWMEEVEQYFESCKDEPTNSDQLGGSKAWELGRIQLKYKQKINKELGMDFYEDIAEVEKRGHKRFSDIIVQNPQGFPELPR